MLRTGRRGRPRHGRRHAGCPKRRYPQVDPRRGHEATPEGQAPFVWDCPPDLPAARGRLGATRSLPADHTLQGSAGPSKALTPNEEETVMEVRRKIHHGIVDE